MIPSVPGEIFSAYGPLGSFSAKIDLCFYFGFLSQGEYSELHRIRRIRNEFAHSLGAPLSFAAPEISNHVSKLRLRRSITKRSAGNRSDFEVSVLVLIGFLYAMLEKAVPPEKPIDPFERLSKTKESMNKPA